MYPEKSGIVKYYFEEWSLNTNVGTFAWLLHRLTGAILALYLFAHILVVSSSLWGPDTFNVWLKLVQTPLTHFLEIFLVAVVAFHLLNGLRITITDFFFSTKAHKSYFWAEIVIFAIVIVITLAVFLPRVFGEH